MCCKAMCSAAARATAGYVVTYDACSSTAGVSPAYRRLGSSRHSSCHLLISRWQCEPVPCISRMSHSTITHLQLQLGLAPCTPHPPAPCSCHVEGSPVRCVVACSTCSCFSMSTFVSLRHPKRSSKTGQSPHQRREVALAAAELHPCMPWAAVKSGERNHLHVTLLHTAALGSKMVPPQVQGMAV